MTKEEMIAVYNQKSWLFLEAIRDSDSLRGYTYDSSKQGTNTWDDRYWSVVLHKQRPDLSRNKESGLSLFMDADPDNSVLFIMDTETNEKLLIGARVSSNDTEHNSIVFGKVDAKHKYAIVQPTFGGLLIYRFDGNMSINAVIQSKASPITDDWIIEAKSSPDGKYIMILNQKRRGYLLKLDWEAKSMTTWELDMFRRPVSHICSMLVLETSQQPVLIASIHATDPPDPLFGYIVFGTNQYRPDRLAQLQLVVTGHTLPHRFDAGVVNAEGYFTLSAFNQNDQVMSISLVPSTKACLEKPVDTALN